MLLLNLLAWWYTAGLATRARALGARLAKTADFFSIAQLLRTLFAPFKQIEAGASGKGPSEAFQAFLSRLLSRCIGFIMRLFLIIAALVVLTAQSALSLLVLSFHLSLPLAPVAALVLLLSGWTPEIDLAKLPLPEINLPW